MRVRETHLTPTVVAPLFRGEDEGDDGSVMMPRHAVAVGDFMLRREGGGKGERGRRREGGVQGKGGERSSLMIACCGEEGEGEGEGEEGEGEREGEEGEGEGEGEPDFAPLMGCCTHATSSMV